MNSSKRPIQFGTVASVMVVMLCAGCNMSSGDAKVAARVDGTIISVKSLEEADPVGDLMQRQRRLGTFVTEQLLANAAARQNLMPGAAEPQGTENEKRYALAKAYLARKKADFPRLTTEDIRAFYESNPALFAQRRIYRLQEIAVQASAERVDQIIAEFVKLDTFNKRAEWLKKNGIAYTTNVTVKPAEDLPADLLQTLAKAKDGSAFDIRNAAGLSSMQVTGLEDAHLTMDQARPSIDAYLENTRTSKMIAEEPGRLRRTAKIEYFAPYAVIAQADSSK